MAKIDQRTALALSLVFGLATAGLVYYKTQPTAASVQDRPAPKVEVVVARQTISPRATIQPEMLAIRNYDEGKQPSDAVRGMSAALGKVAMRQIPSGTVITAEMVAEKGPGLGLSYNLKPYQRAVTVPIDPVSGVAGYLKPGDRVDVVATYSGSATNTSRVVLQDVELLAIGNQPASTSNVKDKPYLPADAVTATLAVGADQMQVLALTAAKAKLQLALRSPDDHAYVAPTPITTTQVFGGSERAPAPPAPVAPPVQAIAVEPTPAVRAAPRQAAKPAPRKTIEVTRGTETQDVPIQ
jgi:pilus assembly protein CpaB